MSDKEEKLDISLAAFALSAMSLIFLSGNYIAYRGIHFFNFFEAGFNDTKAVVEEKIKGVNGYLEPRFYSSDGLRVNSREKVYSGLTVMQGWFSDGAQLRLVNMEGETVHRWMIDFHEIWPNPTHIFPKKRIPNTPYNFFTQGMHVFTNGSVLAVIGDLGLVKMDRCGNIVWKVDRMIHHAVTQFGDGSFWALAHRNYQDISEDLLFAGATRNLLEIRGIPSYENLLLHIDESGRVIQEYSILKAAVDAGMEHQIFDSLLINDLDPIHANDVVEVTKVLADKIEDVNEGDLLVSLRNFHMLAIFDVNSGQIKWSKTGPWVRQHDPDITPEGNITVFNNRRDAFFVAAMPGSNIIEFDPATNESEIHYPKADASTAKGAAFYSDIMGTQQFLPNGNILIAETRRGRVFEVNTESEIVWEYVKSFDDEHAALISAAEKFGENYFTVENWNCHI